MTWWRQRQAEKREREAETRRKRILQLEADRRLDAERARLRWATLAEAEAFLALDPRQFELAVANLFRARGYSVRQTPFVNDRGRDAIAELDGARYVIECKRYARDRAVGRRDLQILFAAMVEEDAGGIMVTTGRFARTAEEFVRGKGIELIDGDRLTALVKEVFVLNGSSSSYFILCRECGLDVSRRLGENGHVTCDNGHVVLDHIPLQEVANSECHQELLSIAGASGVLTEPVKLTGVQGYSVEAGWVRNVSQLGLSMDGPAAYLWALGIPGNSSDSV